ncbi:putative pentatricopeptide repeat-containing protein At1g17630 [Cornus florida]|uniref:putative pentatricopeptide repeat-containing protein At1g17630 n=1 Tax=Cornus florida TaxID=4283 RepID=UPI0028A1D281|nr:putative pentatricopeptide repeat-containing protein At1g17630 [Cornus florida]XP_059643506.1 putative pentatricopeptide repeat-containing protein At1g17630 [Cornus florida]XP_059643507.1 putative pentatricopeptide repeat-containing protein At1g17630 [Cornus florida]
MVVLQGFSFRTHNISIYPKKLSYPSNFSNWVSITTPHNRTQIKAGHFCSTHNEISDFFDHLLRQCTTIQQSKQTHTQIVLTEAYRSAFLAARLVSVYARFGLLDDARKVFETTPIECNSNLLLWNSILRANVTHGEYDECLRVYLRLRKHGFGADGFTFPLVVKACAMMGDSDICRNVHTHVLQMGFEHHVHVANELVGMYGKLGRMDDARRLFDRMTVRSLISWNTIVSGFSLNYDCDGALEMFQQMEAEGLEPNSVTWTALLSSHARCRKNEKALRLYGVMRKRGVGSTAEALAVVISVCAELGVCDEGEVFHGYVIKGGFGNYSFVKNSLICMYGKNGAIEDAKNLFSEMSSKNIVSLNALISSYAEFGLCDEAYAIFSQLEKSDGYPMVRPNVISWSAVISGFASKGRGEESLELFRRMQLTEVMANSVTISCVLSVCGELSALRLGREIHGHVIRAIMDSNILVGNGLINMYTKCGSLKEGDLVFTKIDGRDSISWNSMIAGYGMHGLGENALNTFEKMIKDGYTPDEVTFVAVLSACSHAGLVVQGRKLFDLMVREFKIEPRMEHYACMVDLLGRAGLLQEASDTVKNMPMEPNACVWGALLNSCRMYKNTDVAEETASHIFSLGSETFGSYMLLSDIYAATGRWEDSARVRISAKTKGLRKIPGQSWIEVKKKVYMFTAGNALQTEMEEVYRMLQDLHLQMEIENHVPGTSIGLQDVDEEYAF